MSFGRTSNIPVEKPKIFGAQQDQVDTNEGARVIPFFCGTRWLGVTWLGDVFNVKTTPVKKKVGKRKQIVAHDYYASFVGLVGIGAADTITEIHFDEKQVWAGSMTRGAEDSITITIEEHGNLTLMWGTDTQTQPSILVDSGQEHSAYRGQIIIIGDQMFLGRDRTTVPNIKLRIGRFRKPSWLTTTVATIGNDVNPVAALWDVWTHTRAGLGRSESLLDTARLSTVATTLKTEGIGISPLLTSEDEMKTFVTKLLEHIDGYPTTYARKFGLGLVRDDGGAIPTLDYSDFTADPSFSTQLWPETYSEVRVRFKDDGLQGQDNSARYQDLANFQITGVRKVLSVDRPWVTSHATAMKIATGFGKIVAVPQMSGRATLRDSATSSLDVGSVFNFTTRDGKTLRLRVTDKTDDGPDNRRTSIAFESDRAWANVSTTYTPTPITIPAEPTFTPSLPGASDIVDAPYGLAVNGADTYLYMLARGDTYSTGFDVYRCATFSGIYIPASSDHRMGELFDGFAVRARLTAAYGSTGPLLDKYTGIQFQVLAGGTDELDEEYTVDDGFAHELIAIFPTEIMALHSLNKTGEKLYNAKTLRARYDRFRNAHASGTLFWIQRRHKLAVDAWPPSTMATRYFKFQPHFGGRPRDLVGVAGAPHSGNMRALLPLWPANLRANGDRVHATWQTGNSVTIAWHNTSRVRTKLETSIADTVLTDLSDVKLELRSYDGSTLHDTVTVDADAQSHVLTNAYLVSEVNADFSVRAYGMRGNLASLEYTTVKVDKV